MKDLTPDTTLLSAASPSSYVRVFADPNTNSNYSIVPLKILENVLSDWGRYGKEGLVKIFLECSSIDDKRKVIFRDVVGDGYDTWKKFLDSRSYGDSVSFEPIPGLGANVDIDFLGDAYRWGVSDTRGGNRTSKDLLRRIIEKRIQEESDESRFDVFPQVPFENIEMFFTVPTIESDGHIVLDVCDFMAILRSVFLIKLNARDFAKKLVKGFLSGNFSDKVNLNEGDEYKGLTIQCMLTGKNAYTEDQVKEMTSRNNRSWEEYVSSGCSFDENPRLASLRKVIGSKIYFHRWVGCAYPIEFRLRIFVSNYIRKSCKDHIGAYAQQEFLKNDLIPKFGLAIARLHRPDIFG